MAVVACRTAGLALALIACALPLARGAVYVDTRLNASAPIWEQKFDDAPAGFGPKYVGRGTAAHKNHTKKGSVCGQLVYHSGVFPGRALQRVQRPLAPQRLSLAPSSSPAAP